MKQRTTHLYNWHLSPLAVCLLIVVAPLTGCSDKTPATGPQANQLAEQPAEQPTEAPAEKPAEPTAKVPAETTEQAQSAADLKQGIKVKVVKMVGDFTIDPPLGEIVPQRAPVHVFRGRLLPFDKPNPKHPELIQIVQPDEQGRFELPLPPGEYTVVADIDGKLYLNSWADDGCWMPVVVKPEKWTNFTLENVLEATF